MRWPRRRGKKPSLADRVLPTADGSAFLVPAERLGPLAEGFERVMTFDEAEGRKGIFVLVDVDAVEAEVEQNVVEGTVAIELAEAAANNPANWVHDERDLHEDGRYSFNELDPETGRIKTPRG
ncbi:MAG: hypothetical protein JSS68_14185 [Actinobacteria bacterium]|nr:hypothetical protein [Actinomycetota bacterium]